MKTKFLLVVLLPLIIAAQNNPPQNYTVKGIIVEDTDHVYLNINASTTSVKNQTGWDLALYAEGHEIGGMINETKGVKIWRVFKDTLQFSSLTLADTTFPVSNSSDVFYLGALDTMYTGTLETRFNIGIGDFYQSSLVTIPTKMYIIKREDNVYGKLFISYDKSNNRSFTIRYADIDNTNSRYIIVAKPTVSISSPLTRHFKYVKLQDGSVLNDFEPAINDWDIVFRKYKVGATNYPIGVLTNNAHNLIRLSNITGFPADYLKEGVVKTEAYEAIGDPSTVTYNGSLNSSDPISRNYNQIGEKWLNTTLNQPFSGRSYFIKDKFNRLWHLVFTSYDITSKTLNIAYQQKGSASIESSVSAPSIYNIYQSENLLHIENLKSNKESLVRILDLTGKLLYQGRLNEKLTIDCSLYLAKVLIVQIENDTKLSTSKIILD
jgi:hypothetical protein